MSAYQRYVDAFCQALETVQVTTSAGSEIAIDIALTEVLTLLRISHDDGHAVFIAGNGGSAAVASHAVADFSKNPALRAFSLSVDPAEYSCFANDFGWNNALAELARRKVRSGDIVFVISSSGCSENMLNLVEMAHAQGATVITFSGFSPDNPLRKLGDINLHVNSKQYGAVEIGHQLLCHLLAEALVSPELIPTQAAETRKVASHFWRPSV